jgi:hypothetical protein
MPNKYITNYLHKFHGVLTFVLLDNAKKEENHPEVKNLNTNL